MPEMLIDADCHLSARSGENDISPEALIDMMDREGVDQAVCWPKVAYDGTVAADNTIIYEGATHYPERLIPFGGLNPRLGMEQSFAELERCHRYGFKGVKLNGARDHYFIDDPELSLPVIEAIAASGMILALHCGANDFERTHPFRVGKIAAHFPEMPIIMVHMGGVGTPHLHAAAIEITQQHDNILIADSHADPRWILKAIEILGAHRVCYASDTPFQYMHVVLAMHRALLRDLSDGQCQKVMGGNMQRLLQDN